MWDLGLGQGRGSVLKQQICFPDFLGTELNSRGPNIVIAVRISKSAPARANGKL